MPDPGRPLVLLVEDNTANRTLAAAILDRDGFSVVDAQSGEDALDLLRSLQPDLIVADIHLPKMSGFDLIREIRARPDLNSIPIVAVTAYAMKDDETRILTAGFDAYITKPINTRTFTSQLRRALRAREHVPGQITQRRRSLAPLASPPQRFQDHREYELRER